MKQKKRLMDTIVTYIVLIAVCIFFFFPVLWLIMASFSKSGSIYDLDGFFPKSFSLFGYQKLFTDTTMYDYPNWLKNTLFVSVFSSFSVIIDVVETDVLELICFWLSFFIVVFQLSFLINFLNFE